MHKCGIGSSGSTRMRMALTLAGGVFIVLIFLKHDLSPLGYQTSEVIGLFRQPAITKEELFYSFFDNEYLRSFKDQQLQQRRKSCQPIFGAVLERGTGFGSVLNNALSAYLIASDANVNYTFQLFIRPWTYTDLNEFFEDFAAETSCPIFDTDVNSTKHLVGYNFTLKLNGSHVQLYTPQNITALRHQCPEFADFRALAVSLQHRDGTASIFSKKSLFTKALWNPVPKVKSVIKQLWLNILDRSGRYIGVHIRRGDKISSNEMADIPVKRYVEKLVDFCQLRNGSCPTNIFVIYDEVVAFNQFRELAANSSFTAVNLAHLVRTAGLSEDTFITPTKYQLGASSRSDWTSDIWYMHTRELIISITLMGMADYVVCTYSSNMCRLISLLKGDSSFNTTVGMDGSWFAS